MTLFYEHPLAGLGDYVEPDDFTIEVLRDPGIPALEEAWSFGRGAVRKRILAGHSCYVGLLEGRIAHFSWVQTAGSHHIDSAGRRCRAQDGDLWIYHCRTLDWAHGKHIFPTVLRKILWDHSQSRFRRALIYTTSDNVLSQRGILRAGFVPCGECRSLLLGPWIFAWPGQALPIDER